MKKILIVMLSLLLGITAVDAQKKADKKAVKKSETVTFVTDLDCENCAKKVLDVIPFKKGVKDVVVDVPTKIVKVTYDPRKTTEAALVESLAKIDVHVVGGKATDCAKGGCTDGACEGHNHAGHKH